jgi:hypothetical protein
VKVTVVGSSALHGKGSSTVPVSLWKQNTKSVTGRVLRFQEMLTGCKGLLLGGV